MPEKLFRDADDLDTLHQRATPAVTPGKSTLTSRMSSGRPSQVVFRVESAEAAQVFADRFGPRDANGVAASGDEHVDRAAGSAGSTLPGELRERFESSLGADLSNVRVHTGSESADAAKAVGAKAYTTGNDIHFGAGHYDTGSDAGLHLIAHEVAHTVQQHGSAPTRQNKLEVSTPGDAAEVEADRAADAMVAGRTAMVRPSSALARLVAREADPNEVDFKMTEGRDSADAATGTDVTTQIVTSRSVASDKGEVQNIINDIDNNTPNVQKATERSEFGHCLETNTATRIKLYDLMVSLNETGAGLSQFQGAFLAAKTDYSRLLGMANSYLAAIGVQSDHHAVDTVAGGFQNSVDGQKAAQAANPRAPKKTMGDKMQKLKEFEDYNKKRDALETTRGEINKASGNSNEAGKRLQGKLYRIQAKAAAAKAEKKKNELNKLKGDIAEAVSWVTSCVSIASKVTGALFIPQALTGKQIDDQAGAAVKNLDHDDDGSQAYHSIASTAKDVVNGAGDPATFMKKALEMAESKKIDSLNAAISAANEEESLTAALADANDLAADKQAMATALQTMQELVITFGKNRDNLRIAGEKLAQESLKNGDPNAAVGIRFLTEADNFVATSDVAIKFGEDEQTKGGEAMDKRRAVGATNLVPKDAGQARYYKGRKIIRNEFFGKKAYYVCDPVDVELRMQGQNSNEGDFGSHNVVTAAMTDLRAWAVQVKSLQTSVQGALGMGSPTANTAQTGGK